MIKVTKEWIIEDIIELDRQGIIPILLNAGMHAVGAPSSTGECIGDASWVHQMEEGKIDEIIDEINAHLETI